MHVNRAVHEGNNQNKNSQEGAVYPRRSKGVLKPVHRLFASFLLVCPLLAVTVEVRADAVATARKAIQVQYNKMAAALRKKDIRAYLFLCTSDFQQKTSNAVIDRIHMYQQLDQLLAAADHYTQITHIEGLHLHGNEAQVITTETCTFTQTDPTPAEKVMRYRQTVHNRDIWVYRGKRWLLKSMETQINR